MYKIHELIRLKTQYRSVCFVISFGLFCLSGVPPSILYFAKINLISSFVVSGHYLELVILLVFGLLTIFYYIRIIKIIHFHKYLSKPEDNGTFFRFDSKIIAAGAFAVLIIINCAYFFSDYDLIYFFISEALKSK